MTIPNFLDCDDAFVKPVEAALTEIFHRFDLDKDDLLNDSELKAYFQATNGENVDDESLQELRDSFDVSADGCLTLRGFLELYQLQTLSEPDETWKDLKAHGYNSKFELTQPEAREE